VSTASEDRNLVPIGRLGDDTERASFGAQHVSGTTQLGGDGSGDHKPQGARTRYDVGETVRAPLALGDELPVGGAESASPGKRLMRRDPSQQLAGNELSEVTIDACGDDAPDARKRSGGGGSAHSARSSSGQQRLTVGDDTWGAHAADGRQHEPIRFGGSSGEDGGRQPSFSEGEERAIVTDNDERSRGYRKLWPPPIDNRAVDEPSHVAPSEVRWGGEPPELGVGDARRGGDPHDQQSSGA